MIAVGSSGQLRTKAGKTMPACCAAAGMSGMLPEALAYVRQLEATGPLPGFYLICSAEAPERKEAFRMT